MASLEELREERLKKYQYLVDNGANPYPAQTGRDHSVSEILDNFDDFAKSEKQVTLGGRILAIRKHGGALFGDIFDGTGRIQLLLRENHAVRTASITVFYK